MEENKVLRGRIFKLRVKNPEVKRKLLQNMEVARFAYNWGIQKYQELFDELYRTENGYDFNNVKKLDGKTFGLIGKSWTQFKKEKGNEWLLEADGNITSYVLSMNGSLKLAIEKFWEQWYTKGTRARILKPYNKRLNKKLDVKFPLNTGCFPKFHKKEMQGSYTTDGRKVKRQANQIYIPKIGYVSVCNWQNLPVAWRQSVTISYDGINFYLSLITDIDKEDLGEKFGTIGVDLGLRKLCTLSDGTVIENPAKFDRAIKLDKQIKRCSHKISVLLEHAEIRENINGKRYKYKSRKVRRLELLRRKRQIDLNNLKKTYMQQSVSKICKSKPENIVFEDLDIQSMQKNKRISSSIQQTGMYTFRRMLEDKAKFYDINVFEADRYYASSQICNNCGYRFTDMKDLRETFNCPNCGISIDRDLNASKNLAYNIDKCSIV